MPDSYRETLSSVAHQDPTIQLVTNIINVLTEQILRHLITWNGFILLDYAQSISNKKFVGRISTRFGASLLIQIIILFLLNYFLKYPVFQTNDDAYIANYSQGGFNNTEIKSSLYINILLIKMISLLSAIFENVGIYFVSLIFVLIIINSYLFSILATNNKSSLLINTIWLSSTIFLISWCFISISFTTIALSIAFQSIFFYVNIMNIKNNLLFFLFLGSLIIASIIRNDILLLIIPFFITSTLIVLIIQGHLSLRNFLKSFIPFTGYLAIVYILISSINSFLYSKNGLLIEYLSGISIFDRKRIQNIFQNDKLVLFNETGWTESQFMLLSQFQLFDNGLMNPSKLRLLNDFFEFRFEREFIYFINGFLEISSLFSHIQIYRYVFIYISILSLLALIIAKRKVRVATSLLLTFINFIFVFQFLNLYFKTPERVILPILYGILLQTILIFMNLETLRMRFLVKGSIFLSAIFLFFFFTFNQIQEIKARNDYNYLQLKSSKEFYKDLSKIDISATTFIPISDSQVVWTNPKFRGELKSRFDTFVVLGWFNSSTIWAEHSKSMFNYNHLKSICEIRFNYITSGNSDLFIEHIKDKCGKLQIVENQFSEIYSVFSIKRL